MTHVASPRQAAADVLVGSPRNAAQRRRALELLCARTPAPQRDVELLQLEAGPLDGLFVAVQGDHVLGAALARRQPGRTALVWPPRLTAVPGEQTGTALLRAAVDFAVVGGAALLQALLVPEYDDDQRVLRAAGFRPVALLDYLSWQCDAFPRQRPTGPLHFVPSPSPHWPRLLRIVSATYQATRDCPALNDVRTVADVLDGYRCGGPQAAYHWFVVQADAATLMSDPTAAGRDRDGTGHEASPQPLWPGLVDVGCLLLAAHDPATWELQYMGLSLAARRRGWSQHLVRYAQWLAGSRGAQRLVLAVDAHNEPAQRTYRRAGFAAWEQRVLWVCP